MFRRLGLHFIKQKKKKIHKDEMSKLTKPQPYKLMIPDVVTP